MNALRQEWTPVDGLRAFDGVTVGDRRLHVAYWDGVDGGGDATFTVYVDGSEVGSVGLDGWMLCALTERKSTPEERMAEAAERQAAALERIAVVAEWYQKWRDWDGEAEDLDCLHAEVDQMDEDRRQRNADIDADLAARNR